MARCRRPQQQPDRLNAQGLDATLLGTMSERHPRIDARTAAGRSQMTQAKATTVEEYLDELPPTRRTVVSTLREVIKRNLPNGYEESINWGMITYGVPLTRYSKTYNGQPLSYVALAAQKNYYALHLMCVYGDPKREADLRTGFRTAGKKLDMGKSCLRFKKLDDLPLDVVGRLVASTPVEKYIEKYEASRKR